MSHTPPPIRLRGIRHNNLKGFDLDLPTRQLIVVTGLSGSGKSSLAFDTLFAEGQRRYIETFSPYARQFFDRMDKPRVDSIEGIPPAIAIEQRNAVRTTRSTVGTMTEVCDHLKLLWPHLSRLHCRQCGQPVRQDSPAQIWQTVHAEKLAGAQLITFDLPLTEKLSLADSLELIARQGYQRLLVGREVIRIEEAAEKLSKEPPSSLTVVQDRATVQESGRARFVEACEQAYHFGKGSLTLWTLADGGGVLGEPRRFSQRRHCATCNIEYREPSSALFSFNHPVGACPSCKGFGRIITIDYNLAIPDRSKTLAGGLVRPWQTGVSAECQEDLLKFCRIRKVPTDVPFEQMSPELQSWVIDGEPGYGKDKEHEWPKAWYGVKGYFRWLESKSYKMHVRVLLSRYRSYQTCPVCHGKRFQPEALLYLAAWPGEAAARLTLADFYALPLREAYRFIESTLAGRPKSNRDPLELVLQEVRSRLRYLVEVGLGYLTLDRHTRTLSGGETERVSLTTCLGTRLVNTLFVLDEPSVGLHPRDTARLVRILEALRDTGNTVVVVEHEAAVMQAADQIVDLGPGQGERGGQLVFQGTYERALKSTASLTGQYLSGRRFIDVPKRRPVSVGVGDWLGLTNATRHNLHDLAVDLPLGRFVAVTGVSGSGKTTLMREVLLPALEARLQNGARLIESEGEDEDDTGDGVTPVRLTGWEKLGGVVLVDQSALGRTPRSNPAVYIGAFDDLREVFAKSELAQQRGLNASAFSFNSAQGQCERCRGAGFEKIEMQFLSDVFVRCPDCDGRRYRGHILEVTVPGTVTRNGQPQAVAWNVADLLEATVEEALEFLGSQGEMKPALRAARSLRLLTDVGLGYLRLGQPINTLSGGESQRLKLVSHLAAFAAEEKSGAKPTLFLFDEPTTGLHFEDVRVLLLVFQRMVDAGHSVIVIEHNTEVIKCADWLIDFGPDAGDLGGQVVAAGTPESVAALKESHTGVALRSALAGNGASSARFRKKSRAGFADSTQPA